MSSVRKRPPALKQKPQEGVNKRAIIWIAAAFVIVVAAMTALLIVNG